MRCAPEKSAASNRICKIREKNRMGERFRDENKDDLKAGEIAHPPLHR